MRFLEDGTVLYYVASKQMNPDKIAEILSTKRLEEDEKEREKNGILIG